MTSFALKDRSRLARWSALLVLLLAVGVCVARPAHAAPVTKDAVLLANEANVWNDEFNPEAMEAVFGEEWEMQKATEVQADEADGGLFAAHVHLIWIEGSDESTIEAKNFVTAHEGELKAFVDRGGSLFINSATNQATFIEFDGRSVGRPDDNAVTDAAAALDPTHPIFNGPATPNATSFTGDSFAHGGITGPGLTPLIEGTDSHELVLAEYASGTGHVMIGAMTATEFQEPEEAAESLRINILAYLDEPPPPKKVVAPPPAPPAADTAKPQVRFKGLPKKCVAKGFRFKVTVGDAGGVGAITVKLGGKQLRKADGKGAGSKTIKVRVPSKKLTHPGTYRVKVIATDLAGNVARSKAKFKVCA
jgi:hypothetical protein